MLKDITFGQYIETGSAIHKLDPRSKLVLLILNIVFLFLTKNIYSILFAAFYLVVLMIVSRVPFKIYMKNIKAIWFIIVFTSIINLLYGRTGKTLIHFWKITITTGGVYRTVFLALRIIILILISSVLTYTTTPNDLTDGIESLLSPLRYIGLSAAVHTIAMMMTIALRFIPTLVDETEKIMNAQKARGADLENGKFTDRIKALVPILVPLLISSIRRAYDLAEAMECRCYNGGVGRVKMKRLQFGLNDLFALIVSLVFCAGIIIFNILFKQVII